jgi:hypothetical protein
MGEYRINFNRILPFTLGSKTALIADGGIVVKYR